MRSVAWVALVALIAPARGRASKTITNIMHAGAARFLWKPKWPWVKTKPPKPAKPPQPSTTVRVLRKVLVERGARFRCSIRCLHRKGAPDGKPTPNAETWESRSALATPGTRDNPAGYSRGRRISDAIERLIE